MVRYRSRRTGRLELIVHYLGLALGGRPAASFARRLMVPVSNDTLLRVVRRRAQTPTGTPTVIGIDDFAFRRNHRYGTIVCDLERSRPVVLLKDREQASAEDWLRRRPSIAIVTRDTGSSSRVVRASPAANGATCSAPARVRWSSICRGSTRNGVAACATLPTCGEGWSNGQTEDQVTKPKFVKRQMYGRAKIDLLQARLIGAA